MIEYLDFENIVVNVLERDIRHFINKEQNKAIFAPLYTSLFIAAGPGSGKTTVMVLKILKFVFIDNIHPSNILATTFTRKAASELKSRVIKWGNKLKNEFRGDPKYFYFRDYLNSIDFKKVTIGTIDSISEEVLRKNNHVENSSYAIIEDFIANSAMIKTGLVDQKLQNDRQLKSFLNHVRGTESRLNLSAMSQMLLEVKDRAHHDRIDLKKFIEKYEHPGAKKAFKAISCYENDLKKRSLLDFSMLEEEFLRKLQNNELRNFLEHIKIVMVDEYQDTNLLQESIYFEIAESAVKNGGSMIVVGDDDQSLYRFRGATVDLFKDFKDRIGFRLNLKPQFINLSKNYRSTENIVDFCNSYISLDDEFQNARVKGKGSIVSSRKKPYNNFPVLGMFRDDIKTLAADLATFIYKVVQEEGVDFRYREKEFKIKIAQKEGSPGDIALLCSSPLEQDFKGNSRLPYLLKDELCKFNPQISVFNPRGQHLGQIPLVELICGLILECIDPESEVQKTLKIPRNAILNIKVWRDKALNYMDNPENKGNVLIFKDTWKYELKQDGGETEISIVDIISKIIKLMVEVQDNDELVYVEVITKAITQTGLCSDFSANIILGNGYEINRDSVIEAIWNIFVPIALGAVTVDLDILEDVPKNRVNIMSIHQSKSLEFPVVIVDVGSDFKMNFSYHSFRRFPGTPGKSCTIEDKMREFSPIGKPRRKGLDRAFDDLIRQYFVAFSRPKDILLLVGLNSVKNGYYFNDDTRYIPNVATGWNRDMEWHWKGLKNIVHI